jgi:hypothetical protein
MTTSTQLPPIATGEAPADREAIRQLVSELPEPFRQLRKATMVETLANGAPVEPRALTVVLSALAELTADTLVVTSATVERLLWVGIENFCEEEGLVAPDGCVDALHAVLAVATTTNVFAGGSDRPAKLFAPLHEMGIL